MIALLKVFKFYILRTLISVLNTAVYNKLKIYVF